MGRFIDATKLEDRLRELIQRFPGNLTLPRILEMVEAMPEDIIRCKDCAEGGQTSLGFACRSCILQFGQMRFVNSNGYCSHANRKEETDEHV